MPFVARYRKEATGGLDDTQLRTLADRLAYLRELEARRAAILASIREQGKLTPELRPAIAAADTKAALEDLYLPYKPKRRTKAMIARERGLGPLAEAILADRRTPPETLAAASSPPRCPTRRRRWPARATSSPSGSPRTPPCSAGSAPSCSARRVLTARVRRRARRRRARSSPTTSPIPSAGPASRATGRSR